MAAAVLLLGCPQLRDDDFGSSGLASASSGGALTTAGAASGASGDLPAPAGAGGGSAGGADSSAGAAGASGSGNLPLECADPTPHACEGQCRQCCADGDCPTDRVCLSGICAPVCDSPKVACFDRCVNPLLDENNCGSCANLCGRGRTCASGVCDPSWVVMANPPGAFVARERAAHAVVEGKVFIWGGVDVAGVALQTAASFNPVNNDWTNLVVDANTPTARASAAAVWTGSDVLVWGGGDAASSVDYADGALLNPAARAWRPVSATGAPSARRNAFVFWSGSRVVLWSGLTQDSVAADASSAYTYDPVLDAWTVSLASASAPPSDLLDATVAWSGSVLYVFGGSVAGVDQDALFEYDPLTNAWSTRATGPAARHGAFGEWDGAAFVIWGGMQNGVLLSDGSRWIPNSSLAGGGSWQPLTANSNLHRSVLFRQLGWTASIARGQTLLVGGDELTGGFATTSAIFDAVTGTWTDVPAWPSGALHLFGVAVWSGDEFVLWGGRSNTGLDATKTGERFRP